MGLKAPITKEHNRMGIDFPDAYWSIDNIRFTNENGLSFVAFELNAYPSRESKKLMKNSITSEYVYGSQNGIMVDSVLHSWYASFPTLDFFSESIPLTEEKQKEIMYPKVKKHCSDYIPFEDVLEE